MTCYIVECINVILYSVLYNINDMLYSRVYKCYFI